MVDDAKPTHENDVVDVMYILMLNICSYYARMPYCQFLAPSAVKSREPCAYRRMWDQCEQKLRLRLGILNWASGDAIEMNRPQVQKAFS